LKKKILYVDLDGVLADYDLAKLNTTEEDRKQKGFFENLPPIDGAIDAFKKLSEKYETYFLSTAPWSNIYAPSEKRIWVEKHLGEFAFKKLILTHNKGLLKGDYLIDDRKLNGVEDFEGEHIHFGTEKFKSWKDVLDYLL
jgi:5'-nucleotidase